MKDGELLKQKILPAPKVVGKVLLNNLSYEEVFQKMDEDYLHWESTGYLEKKAMTKRREIIKKKSQTEIFYTFSLRGKSGLRYVLLMKSEIIMNSKRAMHRSTSMHYIPLVKVEILPYYIFIIHLPIRKQFLLLIFSIDIKKEHWEMQMLLLQK